MSWLDKLKFGMKKTAKLFSFSKIDASSLDELEDSLLMADVGVSTTEAIIESIKKKGATDAMSIKRIMKEEIIERLKPYAQSLKINAEKKPFIVLMIGVNGAGKTTTIVAF